MAFPSGEAAPGSPGVPGRRIFSNFTMLDKHNPSPEPAAGFCMRFAGVEWMPYSNALSIGTR